MHGAASRTGNVRLVLGARDAALLRGVVAVEVVDRRTVAGLVALRTVGVRLRSGGGRLRLDASRYEPVARLTALSAEVGRRTAVRRDTDSRAPRRLVAVLAVCRPCNHIKPNSITLAGSEPAPN